METLRFVVPHTGMPEVFTEVFVPVDKVARIEFRDFRRDDTQEQKYAKCYVVDVSGQSHHYLKARPDSQRLIVDLVPAATPH